MSVPAPVEADTLRVRRLSGVWRLLLVACSAATIFLCANQQFALRFFVGFTPLNTEYYYGLVVVMLPFVFLIFPALLVVILGPAAIQLMEAIAAQNATR